MAEALRRSESPGLGELLAALYDTPAMRAKQAIQRPARSFPGQVLEGDARYALPGDDTAAIRCGDHYQLLAIEGMLPAFVESAPWFAGWSAVMANVSDIAAMGGRPSAVVNAYWHHDERQAGELLRGIREACQAYGLLLAGGHTHHGTDANAALAVAITGIAHRLLSTLHVAPGQVLAMAVDLDGCWHPGVPYWKAFEQRSGERLRSQLDVLPRLAEGGLLSAAKDISNAGLLGTLLMLLEPTGCGATLELDALPRPEDGDLLRWLQAFPSYGFLLTLPEHVWGDVQTAFALEGLACARIGRIDATACLRVEQGGESMQFWNLANRPFTGFTQSSTASEDF
ncbi:sll0787 family AIR synthase-like protein [Stutzerimonas stutzeri]|uniref:Sll0787 family AIR synthase-like protein n=1 Tax=Stutzerimonas stutzeri TaxID=316 RepID=A0A2N8SXL8_STUST|nr:sll0787 family AIR synthase-like protein [Stutzerimonas stutzeri]MCQ4325561.1 sll0787 family AIR synthase-like protein [Stutzerimonas stutzeri]PNG07242.1 sll0787 family AIR synthase-like protein [Stutzerimonas stutzeri]